VTKQNGIGRKLTQDYLAQANSISRALWMGIQKNDKIALISTNNRTEMAMDIGWVNCSANCPYLSNISADDYEYILNHSESYCFVSDAEVLRKVQI
jgi:long-chain acyl-CoA synthetase